MVISVIRFLRKQTLLDKKKSDSLATVASVGATYLSGPLPAKYCGQKRA